MSTQIKSMILIFCDFVGVDWMLISAFKSFLGGEMIRDGNLCETCLKCCVPWGIYYPVMNTPSSNNHTPEPRDLGSSGANSNGINSAPRKALSDSKFPPRGLHSPFVAGMVKFNYVLMHMQIVRADPSVRQLKPLF